MSSRTSAASVGIYGADIIGYSAHQSFSVGRRTVTRNKDVTVDPDTRSLRSLMRDDILPSALRALMRDDILPSALRALMRDDK